MKNPSPARLKILNSDKMNYEKFQVSTKFNAFLIYPSSQRVEAMMWGDSNFKHLSRADAIAY